MLDKLKEQFKFIELIRQHKKMILITLGVIMLTSIYFALIMQSGLSGLGLSFNPFVLLGRIPEMGFPLQGSFIIFLMLIALLVFMLYKSGADGIVEDERNFKYSDSGVYGTAALLREGQLAGYAKVNTSKDAEGTILGQLDNTGKRLVNTDMKSRMNRHVAIFGASGTGKSRCYARPFLIQAVKRRESVIVTDPKGELYESTAQYMKNNGYIVKVLDLVHPIKSDGWDCLKELRGDEIRAQICANVIIENTGSGKGDIWDVSAMALLKALLLRVERGKDYKERNAQSIGEAYQLIQNPRGEEYLDEMFSNLGRDEQLCVGPYMTFKQASPNMRGNIITGLAARMQVFQNEVIREITAVDDIDLTLPATQPCAYYCIMSDQHTTLNFLSTLFFTYLFMDLVEYADTHGGRCPVPVNFVLDEFPNIGSIPDFEKKIATVRSRMINISIIFQGITQLQERYPLGKWQGILGNCDTHLFLGCNESDTAEFISERAGETTVKVKTEQHEKVESLFTIGHKNSTGDGKRKIFTPDEIMRFPLNEELIIFRGLNAMKAYKYDFSLHPEAEKFHDIRIMDRPDINDTEGRAEYQRQDDEYMKAYERRKAEEESGKKRRKRDDNTVETELDSDEYREFSTPNAEDFGFTIMDDDIEIEDITDEYEDDTIKSLPEPVPEKTDDKSGVNDCDVKTVEEKQAVNVSDTDNETDDEAKTNNRDAKIVDDKPAVNVSDADNDKSQGETQNDVKNKNNQPNASAKKTESKKKDHTPSSPKARLEEQVLSRAMPSSKKRHIRSA